MKFIWKHALARLTASLTAQRYLQQTIDTLFYFTGVGAGGSPDSSGEACLLDTVLGDDQSSLPQKCVFDVGANNGGFIKMLMKNLDGRKVAIHAFEPGRVAFDALAANTIGIPDLKLNNFGLGAASGEMTLYYSEPGSALASLTKRRLDHFRKHSVEPQTPKSETVRIETIDAYCRENSIQTIDLLKIDVEGHELDVLAGAKDTLHSGIVRFLTFEFGGCNIDTRTFFQDYWYFFKQFPGCEIFRMTPSNYLLPIRKYLETMEQFRASNFLVKLPPLRRVAGTYNL